MFGATVHWALSSCLPTWPCPNLTLSVIQQPPAIFPEKGVMYTVLFSDIELQGIMQLENFNSSPKVIRTLETDLVCVEICSCWLICFSKKIYTKLTIKCRQGPIVYYVKICHFPILMYCIAYKSYRKSATVRRWLHSLFSTFICA